MGRASRPFDETRTALLKEPATAAFYLDEALEADHPEAFGLALRQVADARLGGLDALAAATGLDPDTLDRRLSGRIHSPLALLQKILGTLGLRQAVEVQGSRRL